MFLTRVWKNVEKAFINVNTCMIMKNFVPVALERWIDVVEGCGDFEEVSVWAGLPRRLDRRHDLLLFH